jgi:hypothetical protein
MKTKQAEPPQATPDISARLEYLRGELRAERISYGELSELQSLVPHIAPGDVELLEAAGVPEHPPTTEELLNRPLNEWREALEAAKASGANLQEIEGNLSAMVQRAALLESYISRRFNTGCGDQGHEASAKHANKTLTKIRVAMGYSYPARHMEIK